MSIEFGNPVESIDDESVAPSFGTQVLAVLEGQYEDNLLECIRTTKNKHAASLLKICVFRCGEWRNKHPNPAIDSRCGCYQCCIQKYIQDMERRGR